MQQVGTLFSQDSQLDDWHQLRIDTSIFKNTSRPTILVIHVDTILVFAVNIDLVNNLNKTPTTSSKLEMTNLGEIKDF